MSKLKTITAGALAAITMVAASVTASAENWSIDYKQGAPSSVSTQIVQREYKGLSSTSYVRVGCKVTTGKIELSSTGFNPSIDSVTFYSATMRYENLENPDPSGCTVKLKAMESRTVGSGTFDIWSN